MVAVMRFPSAGRRRRRAGECQNWLSGETFSFRRPLSDELSHEDRHLDLDERHDVPEFLETCAGGRRVVGDRGEAAFGDLAEPVVHGSGAGEQRLETTWGSAEVLPTITRARRSSDHPGIGEEAGGSTDGAATRVE